MRSRPTTIAGRLRKSLRPTPLLAALFSLGLMAPAHALDYVWTGGSGNWADASRWNLLGVPGAGDTATLNGSSHAVLMTDNRSIAGLVINSGTLGGSATLNAGSASFGSVVLGWSYAAAEHTINVSGATSFAGSGSSSLRYGQVLNLNGDATWGVGNGRIAVDGSYAGSSSNPAHRRSQLAIGAGTTFTDLGATAAGGSKTIGYDGGEVLNAGTYVRNGLGTTVASYGFNNTGTVQVNSGSFQLTGNGNLRGLSSGVINVASGATLNLGDADITAGSINNSGTVLLNSSAVTNIAAGATIGGAWQMTHGTAQLHLSGTHSISSLTMSDGYLGGTGTLNVGTASFGSAVLGWNYASAENTLNVSGITSFAGSGVSSLRYGQMLNLNGDATWGVGNGRIAVDGSYAGSSSNPAHRRSQLAIGAGTTFTDLGATAAGGSKTIGYDGGEVLNAGTYVRNGLGTTVASYGFNNTGTVQVNSGSFQLTGNGNLRGLSSGVINVASGATLNLGDADITAGSINNSGTVLLNSSAVTNIAAGATIGGAWQMTHGTAQLHLSGTHSISSLTMSDGYLGGTGTLNVGTASFGSAVLGWNYASAENTLNVSGITSFAGSGVSSLRYGQMLNLNGDATWGVGNGRIAVDGSYAGSSSNPAHRRSQLAIGAGTTFTDLGATAAGGSKTIGYDGGEILNAGTYVRNGLGTTVASYGFNNTGTVQVNSGSFQLTGNGNLRGLSSGVINVASGATLNLGDADITAGNINNSGTVLLNSSAVTNIAAGATIGGAWQMTHGTAQLHLSGTHSISSLTMSDGYLGGTGTLNVGTASFGSAVLGWDYASAEHTINVSGNTSFAGSGFSSLRYGQVLNLNGDATWGVGNGRIAVDGSYAGDSVNPAHRRSQLAIGAGTTFTDLGANTASASKTIGYGGGEVLNAGTYVRNGLGTTVASYGFNNTGTVLVNQGRMSVDDAFRNTGTVVVAEGAQLVGADFVFRNDGVLRGSGTVVTRSLTASLQNLGHIQPGDNGSGGTLNLTGDLLLQAGGTLDIDLVGLGQNDLIAVSSDFTAGGTLALWAAGYAPVVGDSFVIASFSNLTAGSQFANVSWNGGDVGSLFSVQYNANNITLNVTAVPEPATWATLMAGALLLLTLKRRRQQQA